MKQHLTTQILIDYMHGALGPEQDASVYAHLESCAPCRAEYDVEASLTEALRTAAAAEERELPPGVKAAIWQQVRGLEPSPLAKLRAWLRPAYALPIAAALVVAAWVGNGSLHHGATVPSIEAAYYLQDHAAMDGTIPFGDHAANPTLLENESTVNADQASVSVPVQSVAYDSYAGR